MSQMVVKEELPENHSAEADICIIGSGAAGCVLAYELAKSGKSIIILEKGRHYSIEWIKKMQNDEHELLRLWKNRGIFVSRNYSVNIAQGQCVGGSTMINYGICFEIPDAVFSEWQRDYDVSISKDELKAAYKQVGDMINVRKIDPLDAGKSHVKLKEGCKKLGYSGDWMSKCYIPDKGKQSAYVAYLQKANFDNISLYANCSAKEILVKGKKAVGVNASFRGNKSEKPEEFKVRARIVILAAGPIGSSELLLQNNLSNSNGQVGKHLSVHPSSSILAEFDEELQGDEGYPMAFYCDQFSIRKNPERGFVIESVFVPPSQYAIITPSYGSKNKELYLKNYNHAAMAGILVHDEPKGTVTLNWQKDAVVDYELSEEDQKKMTEGLKNAACIYLEAGAKRVITGHIEETVITKKEHVKIIDQRGAGVGALLMASAHPQGGNRMGDDRSKSVVNSHCQSHDIENLYVCDASVFPTAVGVNPQYTVMAIATITANYIINHQIPQLPRY
jgi:choline dehydrogenase-like flavoprotein